MPGWEGPRCDTLSLGGVDVRCNHGVWIGDECKCYYGWLGQWCNEEPVDDSPQCYYGWINDEGGCTCLAGWTGTQCAERAGNADPNHGVPQKTCKWGEYNFDTQICDCMTDYSGDLCETYTAPTYPTCEVGKMYDPAQLQCVVMPKQVQSPGCYHGEFNEQWTACKPDTCEPGYSGTACEVYACKNGYWDEALNEGAGGCKCHQDFTGAACDTPVPRTGCENNGLGFDVEGECKCKFGTTCSKVENEKCVECSGTPITDFNNGYVNCAWGAWLADQTCHCYFGYTLDQVGNCTVVPVVPEPTHICEWGVPKVVNNNVVCDCMIGYTGTTCDTEIPPTTCLNGWFINGECKCADGWAGEACTEQIKFPKICKYEAGVSAPCLNSHENDCGYGVWNAETETCSCVPPFEGEQCNELAWYVLPDEDETPKPFHCVHGVIEEWMEGAVKKQSCRCMTGYRGDYCDLPICLNGGTPNELPMTWPMATVYYDMVKSIIGLNGLTFKLRPMLRDEFCMVQMEVGFVNEGQTTTVKIVRPATAKLEAKETAPFNIASGYTAYVRFPSEDVEGMTYELYEIVAGVETLIDTVTTLPYPDCQMTSVVPVEIFCTCPAGFYGTYCQESCTAPCHGHGTICNLENPGVCQCFEDQYVGDHCELLQLENQMLTSDGLLWEAEGHAQISAVPCVDTTKLCIPATITADQGPARVTLYHVPPPAPVSQPEIEFEFEIGAAPAPQPGRRLFQSKHLTGEACTPSVTYDEETMKLTAQVCEGTYAITVKEVDDDPSRWNRGGALSASISMLLGMAMLICVVLLA
jgi:hypothetical protein